jgi:transposase
VDANGLPMQLGLTPARLTKIGSARIYWRDCSRNQCCWQIASMTQTGSKRSSISRRVSQYSAEAQAKGASLLQPLPVSHAHNLAERFFNMIKQCRRIATRYNKLAANYLAFVKLAAIRIWLRVYESTSYLDQNDKSNRLVTGADVLK